MPHKKAIGVDFGGTSIKFGVCLGEEVVGEGRPIDTTAYYERPREDLIRAITDRIAEIRQDHPEVASIGAGIPGLVDFQRGHIFEITNVPDWVEVPFRDILTRETGLPVTVDNDANCMAYAEWHHGAGRGFDDLLAITLGTGVGGGLVIGGQLHRGAQFCAGELGHTTIDHRREPRTGIIEQFVGNRQIAQHAQRLYADAGIDKSTEDCSPKNLANANDEIASQVWADFANWLAIALSNAVWLLNPEAIVIGGGVSRAGPVLFDPLKTSLAMYLSPVLAENIQLIPAKFGNEAGIIGAAAQSVTGLHSEHSAG